MSQDQYDCRFKLCPNDSLQISIKDRKNKRKFSGLFSKAKLESLNLQYSTNEIYQILQTAKDAKKNNLKNWRFLVKYISSSSKIEDLRINATNTLFSYKCGDKMVLLLNVNEPRFYMKTAFKLTEMSMVCKPRSITLQQSTTNSTFPFDKPSSRSPSKPNLIRSKSPKITLITSKSPRKSSPNIKSRRSSSKLSVKGGKGLVMKTKKSMDDITINDQVKKIEKLEKQIYGLQRNNDILLNKIRDITTKTVQSQRKQNEMEQREERVKANQDKLWLKQKIERMEKTMDIKILRNLGINFRNNNNDWKDSLNTSFIIIQKLSKQLNLKEEQYESVSNKWIISRKENKDLKKQQDLMRASMERQKIMINEAKQQICDRDKRLNLNKNNERNLEDKIKKLQIETIQIKNDYNKQIEDMRKEKIRLNVKLNNSLQEMKESKTDFDEISKQNDQLKKENNKIIQNIEQLKYLINETNQKSSQLIECINNSKHVLSNISYNNNNNKNNIGNHNDMLSLDLSSFIVVGNNNFV